MHNRIRILQKTVMWVLALLAVSLNVPVLAGEKENQIIDQAIMSYGGEHLKKLKSLTLQDNMYHFSQWQTGHNLQGAMTSYLSEYQIELSIDFHGQRKEYKEATLRLVGSHSSDTPAVTHRIYANGSGYNIDHALKQYHPSTGINFENADLGISSMLDTLIVKQLDSDRASSHWTDIAYIQGIPHDVLTINSGSQNEYVVYLNQSSGYLTRLLRKRGQNYQSYDFLEHQKSQNIVWAKQLFVGSEKNPTYLSNSRKVSFNKALDSRFDIPKNYQKRPKTKPVDVSQLTLNELADGVYLVGQQWGYTLFIDTGDYYISAGSWQMDRKSEAWKQGLELLRQKTGDDKPIKQHIVTHHHNDHMMGLEDVLNQGTNLVIHPTDIPLVQQHLPEALPKERFLSVSETHYLANGKVMLFDVPNSHANHNLVIYLPEYKLLFTEDMFGSSYQKALHSPSNWPDLDTYYRLDVLVKKLKELNLEVAQYISSHHARVMSQSDIDKALTVPRNSQNTMLERLFN